MHFLLSCFSLYGFMRAAYTERCTSSLSYLLVQLIFSVPSEAAAHWFLHTRPKCQSQDVLANPVTKWKFLVPHWEELSQTVKDAHFVTNATLWITKDAPTIDSLYTRTSVSGWAVLHWTEQLVLRDLNNKKMTLCASVRCCSQVIREN